MQLKRKANGRLRQCRRTYILCLHVRLNTFIDKYIACVKSIDRVGYTGSENHIERCRPQRISNIQDARRQGRRPVGIARVWNASRKNGIRRFGLSDCAL